MENEYWLQRKREELALACSTTCPEAKLIHLDLAGRYNARAGEEALRPRIAHIETAEEPGLVRDGGRKFSTARQSFADRLLHSPTMR